jgi:hypothetical protein
LTPSSALCRLSLRWSTVEPSSSPLYGMTRFRLTAWFCSADRSACRRWCTTSWTALSGCFPSLVLIARVTLLLRTSFRRVPARGSSRRGSTAVPTRRMTRIGCMGGGKGSWCDAASGEFGGIQVRELFSLELSGSCGFPEDIVRVATFNVLVLVPVPCSSFMPL